MAMPASGQIAIISAPQICGSICAAVGCASGSLVTLSVAAGKTAPHGMTEFYGYAGSQIATTVSAHFDSGACIEGTAWLRCCNSIGIYSCCFCSTGSHYIIFPSVSAGCYYVDFSGVKLFDGYGGIMLTDYCWSDCFSYGYGAQTNKYSANNNIVFNISAG